MREIKVQFKVNTFTVRLESFQPMDIRIRIRKDMVEIVTEDGKVWESVKRLPWIHLQRDYQLELLTIELLELLHNADYKMMYQKYFNIKFTDYVTIVKEDELYHSKVLAKRYFKAYDKNFNYR